MKTTQMNKKWYAYKNNAVVSLFPVDGGGNFVVVGELKRIQYTKDLIKVAACRCGKMKVLSALHITAQIK